MSHFDAHSLSLHDALPIFTSPSITFSPGSCRYSASSPYHNARPPRKRGSGQRPDPRTMRLRLFLEVEPQAHLNVSGRIRSEEHTSELQSLRHLVCRLLLEK